MALWIKMAFKKLISNKKKSLLKVLFFSTIFSIIFSLNMIKAGCELEMLKGHRSLNSDVLFMNKNDANSLGDLFSYVSKSYGEELEAILPGVTLEANVNSSTSYSKASCIGSSKELYRYIEESLGWIEECNNPFKPETAMVEASLASSLNIKNGDFLTIKYRSEEGMLNSIDVEVDGIYIGVNLLYENTILLNISDLQFLKMDYDYVNRVRLYFEEGTNESFIRDAAIKIKKSFFKSVNIESPTLDPEGGIMGIFSYYKMLITFVLYMVIIVFLVVLNFSNQNIFFMEFRSRRGEISTFLTYGMRVGELKKIIFFESIFIFIFSLSLSILGTSIFTEIVSGLRLDSLAYADIISVLGGTRIYFKMLINEMLVLIGLLFIIVIYSAQRGAGNYLKMEIREIISTSK